MTNEDLTEQLFDLYAKYVDLSDKWFTTTRKLSEVEWQYKEILKSLGKEVVEL